MIKEKVHKITTVSLAILSIVVFLVFVAPYLINICTNYRLHYFWEECKGFPFFASRYIFLGYTPNKSHAIHSIYTSWLGQEIEVEATKHLSYKPTKILWYGEEGLKYLRGH